MELNCEGEDMNQEHILKMAREAGIFVHERKQQARIGLDVITGEDSTAELMRFADLVAAKAAQDEREACAKLCEEFAASRPIACNKPSPLIIGRWEGEQAASVNVARMIRIRGQ